MTEPELFLRWLALQNARPDLIGTLARRHLAGEIYLDAHGRRQLQGLAIVALHEAQAEFDALDAAGAIRDDGSLDLDRCHAIKASLISERHTRTTKGAPTS